MLTTANSEIINPFQNKSNIEQFNSNNFFNNNSPLLLNQQFQQMQSNILQPQQQVSSISDLLFQPQQQQPQQQQSPMLGQMPRMHSVLLQSDTNLLHSQQQQLNSESLQNFRTNNNTLNQNINNQK